MSNIVSNKIKTPDGTVIESIHRHDFVCHVDKITGLEYCVDGGKSYLRRVGGNDYTELSVSTDDSFEVIRNEFKWGTYGKDGNSSLHYIPLKNMETEHIKAILDECAIEPWVRELFVEELSLREDI